MQMLHYPGTRRRLSGAVSPGGGQASLSVPDHGGMMAAGAFGLRKRPLAHVPALC